jgi:hypothetical protein
MSRSRRLAKAASGYPTPSPACLAFVMLMLRNHATLNAGS